MIRYVMLFSMLAVLAATPRASADIVIDWNTTIRNVMQSDGQHLNNKANPGWATRSIAMMNGAIYDTFQAINRTHKPYMVNTTALPDTSLEAAVHQAAYELLHHCYPGELTILDAAYNARMSAIPAGAAKVNGIALGTQIAQVYKAARASDHADEIYPYAESPGAGKWRSDPFNPGQVAWGPGWHHVHPFAISNTADFVNALPPIPDMTSQAYADAFHQVKEYGAIDSAVRTQEQKEIGLFWAYDRPTMGPPPVLFNRNLEEIALQANNTPEQNARLFALASVAQADAAIAAWDAKFKYDFWRPVAAIHEADTDGNPNTSGDPTWRPLGAPGHDPHDHTDDFTPPFPAWTSGHATMGGAVFKALELFYGTNSFDEIDGVIGNNPVYSLTSEEQDSGTTRDFVRFTQDYANGLLEIGNENSPEGENGTSRIYLGIHWIFDQRDGITLGNDIAAYVASNYFQAVPEPSSLAAAMLALAFGGLARRPRRD